MEGLEGILCEQEKERREIYHVITDAIGEMEWWATFKKSGRTIRKPAHAGPSAVAAQTTPPPKVHKKPWRNAPCPCGSGRKYKHCCGKK